MKKRNTIDEGKISDRIADLEQLVEEERAKNLMLSNELTIEAALESIRVKSLSMRRTEDLKEVVKAVFLKLQELKFAIDGAAFILTHFEDSDVRVWIGDDNADYPTYFRTPFYRAPPILDLWEAKTTEVDFFSRTYSMEEKNSWFEYAFNHTDYKNLPDQLKLWILEQSFLTQSFAFRKYSGIGIHFHTKKSLSESEIHILKRFSEVFEQAYTRFLDLQKAEAQVRKAQIEAALERIRARTMAMHKSEELLDAADIFSQELVNLEIPHFQSGFVLINERKSKQEVLMGVPGQEKPLKFFLPLKGDPILKSRYESWKKQESIFHQQVTGDELARHLDYVSQHFESSPALEMSSKIPDPVIFYCGNFKEGYLHIVSGVLLSEGQELILSRFTNAFQQTYTRFLDLQKAEKQAREGEIQLSLERVRASSMAMHQSDELNTVLSKMFSELKDLDYALERCVIWIYHEEERSVTWYSANPEGAVENYLIPYSDYKVVKDYWKFWKKRIPRKYYDLSGDLKRGMDDYIFNHTEMANLPEEVIRGMAEPEQVHIYNSFSDFGALFVSSIEPQRDEIFEIIERFSNVFNQAYTRFLDVQKAEAQAREARIEAALERVRAAAMAMHNSKDVSDATTVMFSQLDQLGVKTIRCGVALFHEDTKSMDAWASTVSNNKRSMQVTGKIDMTIHPLLGSLYDSWKDNLAEHQYDLQGEELKSYYKAIIEKSDFNLPVENRTKNQTANSFYFPDGALYAFTEEPLVGENAEIFRRFAKVFTLTYRRYLDLQKAEARAREAQIEAALERVRSRTMAMHNSEELSEVAALLFNELKLLGATLWTAGFAICKEDDVMVEKWMGSPILGQMFDPLFIPHTADHGEQKMYDTWKNSIDLYCYVQDGKELSDIYEHLMSIPTFKANFQRVIDEGTPLPVWQKNHVASYKYGYLLIITTEDFEEEHVFPRFAKVFDQTYTRFLDLQKAEAQAREAEIQLSLERVRARTMAMHKSDEMLEVGELLYRELSKLGIASMTSGITIIDKDGKIDWSYVVNTVDESMMDEAMGIPRDETKVMRSLTASWEKQDPYHLVELNRAETIDHQTYVAEHSINFDIAAEALLSMTPEELKLQTFNFKQGYLLLVGADKLSKDLVDIGIRFSKAFEQTYTRFLDLQKAEAQSREAEIQLSLERVRARTMAMHKSVELGEVARTLYTELQSLGFVNFINCGFIIIDEEANLQRGWGTLPGAEPQPFFLPLGDEVITKQRYQAWKRGDPVLYQEVGGTMLKKHIEYAMPHLGSVAMEEMVKTQFTDPTYFYSGNFSHGYLFVVSTRAFDDEQLTLVQKFTSAFELAFQRFLDLEKAEAQVREAQIEAALERVRAKTMAMHQSSELGDVVHELFQQMHPFGIAQWGFAIRIALADESGFSNWLSSPEIRTVKQSFNYPNTGHWVLERFWKVYKDRIDFESITVEGKDKAEMDSFILTENNLNKIPKQVRKSISDFEFVRYSCSAMKYGILVAIDIHESSGDEDYSILTRFAKVFEQTYTRFLDLQKAEAQAREAQIQLGLERVRARAMAMQTTDELKELIGSVFTELTKLDLLLTRCIIMIYDPETWGSKWWMANSEEPSNPSGYFIKYHEEPPYLAYVKAWQGKPARWQYVLEGAEKVDWDAMIFRETELSNLPDLVIDGMKEPDRVYLTASFNNFGCLSVASLEGLEDEHSDILLRFAKTFDLTYTRFNDLKQAETQAREAQIEAALERVRSKAMAMRSSEDLADTVEILYKELDTLQIHALRFGHAIVTPGTKTVQLHTATDLGKVAGHVELEGHPLLEKISEHLVRQEDLHYVLQGEEMKSYYEILSRSIAVPIPPEDAVQYGYFFFQEDTANYAWSDKELNEEELKVYGRLITVLNLMYKRYEELKNAEIRAREARIEAALDRVHAQIASMRTTEDLQRITPLIWNELTTLGVPFIRCGVFIIDDSTETVQVYLSTPDGRSLGMMQMVFTANTLTLNAVAHWRKSKIYKTHWNQQQFIDFMQSMINLGQIENKEVYMGAEHPPESLHLHFVPFSQGMLYVGSTEPLEAQQVDLVQSLADTFAIAYARYEDFVKLEKAKQSVESTLTELRSTQAQLIQSEKMASLGELTAGIAHEIQNPLNFVNNFSEVSAELVDEVEEEIEKGDLKESKSILTDLKKNINKIFHHGNRASSIVKGMLDHSRTNAGEKIPTDINALCDEYLRLAYHGLRAKDKSFNASFETDLDLDLPQLDVVPQDIGRVLLNLLNNAFHAVGSSQSSVGSQQSAVGSSQSAVGSSLVIVKTKSIQSPEAGQGQIIITVEDNGPGIPEEIKEKIFQPFFTTKSTGEGTGLGLSLAYDIVKAHGGEIKVDSVNGVGTKFIIVLPIVGIASK